MREPPVMQAVIAPCPLENQMQGPLTDELAEIAPAEYEGRIQRSGVVNALDDPDFAAAVQATGQRNLIMAGVTNEVSTGGQDERRSRAFCSPASGRGALGPA